MNRDYHIVIAWRNLFCMGVTVPGILGKLRPFRKQKEWLSMEMQGGPLKGQIFKEKRPSSLGSIWATCALEIVPKSSLGAHLYETGHAVGLSWTNEVESIMNSEATIKGFLQLLATENRGGTAIGEIEWKETE